MFAAIAYLFAEYAWCAEPFEGYDGSATTFNSGPVRKTCVLRLRLPIGIPQALIAPELPSRSRLVRLPDPTEPVDAISLDFEDWTAVAAINRWALQDARTEPGDTPGVGLKNQRARNRMIVVCVALAVAIISLQFTLPS